MTCRQLTDRLTPGGRLVITFATAQRQPNGEWRYWPIHNQAATLTAALNNQPGITAEFRRGPNSRHYNNMAIVIDKSH